MEDSVPTGDEAALKDGADEAVLKEGLDFDDLDWKDDGADLDSLGNTSRYRSRELLKVSFQPVQLFPYWLNPMHIYLHDIVQ